MTPTERTAFLAERQTGLGGSDIASLLQPYLSEVKYGCRRRLWYDKSGIPEDYPQDDTGPMRLGRILEPHIAEWHMEATGDELSQPDTIRHPEHPELLVHIDRIVRDRDHIHPGAAEIKALGPDMFWETKRNGIIPDYLLQLQAGILLRACAEGTHKRTDHWGKFIIGNRAYGGTPLSWTHNADKDIHEAILEDGPAFWKTLRNPDAAPARLEPDDKRCGSCQWRRTCQGDSLIQNTDNDKLPHAEDIRPLLIQYDEVNAKFTEKLPDGSRGTVDDLRLYEIKEQIKATLDKRDAVRVSGAGKDRKVYFRQQDGRVSWKTDEMVKAYESLRLARRKEYCDGITELEQKFDAEFPPAPSFMRQGVPYRTLRIY